MAASRLIAWSNGPNWPSACFAQQTVLAEHQGRVLHLGETGGEVVVPEQGHLLTERMAALEHAVEPPTAELLAAVVVDGGDPADIDQRLQSTSVACGLPLQEQVERALETESLGLEQIFAAGPEGRTAVEVGGPLASPGVGSRRLPGLPGLAGSIWSSVGSVAVIAAPQFACCNHCQIRG